MNLAEGAKKFGQQHGGFFITTMEESNGNWYYWGQNSNFIPAWRHIWQIFEDQGANQYATWVWEFSCTESSAGSRIDPELMYPEDRYVDWIGMSAFSRDINQSSGWTLGALIRRSYDRMRKNHSDKPIMQAEFAKSNRYDQPRWLIDAYKSIKTMPGIKAAVYRDIYNFDVKDDNTLSNKSFETLKQIFKDPYWIMAK